MIELKIMVDERGQVSLNGPIDNVMLCYGLLEVARDIIKDRQAQIAKAVVPATGDDVRRLTLG